MSCRSEPSKGLYGVNDLDQDRKEVRKLVAKLSAAKTMIESADDEATFEEAKEALILMGSGIQSVLFEELASSDDWGVRYGIVHVLSAIGTQRMVEPLISVLDDPEPQVAWFATQTLQIVCEHVAIPANVDEATAEGANGLPPLPVSEDDGASQERAWRDWHSANGFTHRQAWEAWWEEKKMRVSIE